jgi:deoxyguanosine kinase
VLEGVDAAGKSAVAQGLAARGQAIVVESPPAPLATIKGAVLEELAALPRLLYFMAANLHISAQVQAATAEQPLVAVRYIWSTLAYHATIERVTVASVIGRIGPFLDELAMPTSVFYLTADDSIRASRMAARSESGLSRDLSVSRPFQDLLQRNYDEVFQLLPVDVVRLDTTVTTLDATVALAARQISLRAQ